MSRRQRGSRRVPDRAYGNVEPSPRAGRPSAPAPDPSLREQLEGAGPAARALLPIRFFFGLTFVYAGLDKLLDPAFLSSTAPTSIVAQLAAFARTSPLAPLIGAGQPFAVLIGLAIAVAELAIGIGALTGLAFRLAAAGGAALSLLFFLTASWATHPYYYGADLPYAAGWLALAIAGDCDLLVPRVVRDLGAAVDAALPWGSRLADPRLRGFRPPRYLEDEPSPSRRLVMQTGVLGALSLGLAALALPIRFLRGADDVAAAGNDGGGDAPVASSGTATATGTTPTPSSVPGGPTSAPRASSLPGFTPSGLAVATTAQVDAHGAVRIQVPVNAPTTLPAGDPALIVKLRNGSYACFDATCTHEGCRVGWDARDAVMLCPCHGAAFDPNHHAAVLQGPTDQPLLELPISIDPKTGTISLQA